jgi:hypothetical protein
MREEEEQERRGTWKHAAFHVATTIATPAAYAPLPFALASLGWPLGLHFLYFTCLFILLFYVSMYNQTRICTVQPNQYQNYQ